MEPIRYWGGPFATPLMGGDASTEGDVPMPTASSTAPTTPGHGDGFKLANAPTLLTLPKYSRSTLQDHRDFTRAYETYYRALVVFVTPFNRPFVMPVSACIEERTGRMICLYEFKKDPNLVTEEWIVYFKAAFKPEQQDYAAADDEMKTLRLDVTLKDADSRMGKLRADMHRILDKHNVEAVMLEKERKKIVSYLSAALGPDDFREAVRTRLSYEENKQLRSDVIGFYGWALELMRSHMLWRPALSQARKFRSHPKQQPQQPQHYPQRSLDNASPAGSSGSTPPASAQARDRRRCLNCNSPDHLVRDCPDAGPGDAVRLIVECYPKTKQSPPDSRQAAVVAAGSPWDGTDKGTAMALINGDLPCSVLLDSGADDSVVGAGLVNALHARGIDVSLSTLATPTMLCPVGDARIRVTRKARLSEVKIETSAGPLVLRGLECWVHEEELGRTMIIGRPTMTMLGYSTDGFLSSARAKNRTWQLAGLGGVSSFPSQ
ncbi:hypothetical protein V7S43_004394 [Phytophthora oleae]|uniref:CCHC-type domain-containing protein n=1 Tax=Phytophthora oleae TaxID=2107226 RepID=A0ABD3FTM1_9STRA